MGGAHSPRQRQIVDVALRVLAREGPRALTSQRLAAELSLTTGAIFRHFESMPAVVGAVVDRMEALLFAGFPPSGADPVQRLERFFLDRTACIRAHPELSRLLLSGEIGQCGAPREGARVEAFKRRTQAFLLEAFLAARDGGRLAPQVNPPTAVLLVVGAVTALAHAGSPSERPGRPAGAPTAPEVWTALARALFVAPEVAAARRGAPRRPKPTRSPSARARPDRRPERRRRPPTPPRDRDAPP